MTILPASTASNERSISSVRDKKTSRSVETSISGQVRAYAYSQPAGCLLQPNRFLNLGRQSAVYVTFLRMEHAGELRRVGRGLYMLDDGSGAIDALDIQQIAEAFRTHFNCTVTPSRQDAARAMGLTNETEPGVHFLTNEKSCVLHINGQDIHFHKGRPWEIRHGNTMAGQALRAISWAGYSSVRQALEQMKPRLTPEDVRLMQSAMQGMPVWLARALRDASYPDGHWR